MSETLVRKKIDDLGIAAYLRMYGFKVVGREGKVFFFDIQKTEENEFSKTMFNYANSECHTFDSELMSLKKMPHYNPEF